MGHYGALWGVFKRDISKSIQANPIVPHNAPWLPPTVSTPPEEYKYEVGTESVVGILI